MVRILDIRVQKLFLVVLVLKVLSSGMGWYFGRPWDLGFAVPLALMSAYILIGLKRNDKDVTDEKFADTCYYLGFIFTITSISSACSTYRTLARRFKISPCASALRWSAQCLVSRFVSTS